MEAEEEIDLAIRTVLEVLEAAETAGRTPTAALELTLLAEVAEVAVSPAVVLAALVAPE